MPLRAIGEIIRQRRLALGLTQEDLVERVSDNDGWLKQSDISRIETGAVKLPRPERLQAIADALDLSLGELLLYASSVDDDGQVLVDTARVQDSENAAENGSPGAVWDDPHLPRTLLEHVAQAVIVTDPGGTIRYWNSYAEALYGWCADEVLGRSVEDVTVADQRGWQEQAAAIMRQLKAGHGWSGAFRVRRRDGSTFMAQVTLSPVLDKQGVVFAVFGTSSPVTTASVASVA